MAGSRSESAGGRRSELRLVLGIGATALLLIGAAPWFLDTYTVSILIRALLLAVLALTVDILWGYTGILTFGQSAFFGIGAYACALVFTHGGFGPGWAIAAIAIGILAAMAVGGLVGWLAFYHGASPLYGSIVTLALPIVFTQIVFSGGRFTGSSSGLSGFPTYYWTLEIWFWIAGGFLVVVTGFAWLFVRSDMGRVLVAIRENETRCAYLGIPVSRIKILLMAAAGAVGAVAGFAYAAFTNVVAPELGGFLLGVLCDRTVYRPLIKAPALTMVLATVGFSFLIKGIARFFWGAREGGDYVAFPAAVDPAPIPIGGIMVFPQQLLVLGGAFFFVVVFTIFFRRTLWGKMMQATAENATAAFLSGIRVERVYTMTWGTGACIASAAAVLMAPLTLLSPDVGFNLLLRAFAATVLGGLGSMPGAIIGGFLVGIIESLAGGYVHTGLQEVSAFIIIIVVLVFRPAGLFGIRRLRET